MDQGVILALLVFIYRVANQAPRAIVNGEIDRSQFHRRPVQDWHLFFSPEEICNHGTALDDMYFNMITFLFLLNFYIGARIVLASCMLIAQLQTLGVLVIAVLIDPQRRISYATCVVKIVPVVGGWDQFVKSWLAGLGRPQSTGTEQYCTSSYH
jgi:hypothetical protein